MTLEAKERPGRSTQIGYGGEGTTATRVFDILAPGRIYGFDAVSGLPALGDPYPEYSGSNLVCSGISATEAEQLDGGQWLWTATATYNTAYPNGQLPQAQDPLDRTAVKTWTTRLVEETPLKDLDDKDYVNSAGEALIDPAPVRLSARMIMTARFNMGWEEYSGGWALSWINKINNASWYGGDTGTVLVEEITANERFEEYAYWEVSMVFQFRPDKWHPRKFLNCGTSFIEYNGITGEYERRLMADTKWGSQSNFCMLKTNGDIITPDEARAGEPATYLEFRENNYANFSLLPI